MLDLNKIEDIEFSSIDYSDYPKFSDAYIINAVYPAIENPRPGISEDWRELTENELEYLNFEEREFVHEKLWEYLY